MGARKDNRGYWLVNYRDEQGRGRTRSFGKGATAKKLAEEFALEIEYLKLKGQPLPLRRSDGIYLDDLAQEWVDWKKAQGRKEEWLAEWVHVLNKYFLPRLCHCPCQQLSQAEILAIIAEHYSTRSQATRNRYLQYLKSIFEFGVSQGYLTQNPLRAWRKGRESGRRSALKLEDLKRLARHAAPHLAWALEVLWNVPVRPGDSGLYALRFDRHVQYDAGGFEVFHAKVGRWVFVPCGEDFMRAVYAKEKLHTSGLVIEYAGRPVKRLDTALKTAARRAQLAYPVCMYDVRHLWITTMLNQGLDPGAVAAMAGTSVDMIVSNYYEQHQSEKAKAVGLLPPLSGEQRPGEHEKGRKVVSITGRDDVKAVVNARSGQRGRG